VTRFDNTGFSSTQAMDGFIREFGELGVNGKYAIPPYFLSLMNSKSLPCVQRL
jgi:hypothetical protein